MTGEDTNAPNTDAASTLAGNVDALVTLVRHEATVLSDAADRLARGPQSARWYEDQAATCQTLATAFTTRAANMRAEESRKDDSDDGR